MGWARMPLHASVNDVSAREAGSRCWSAARPSHGDANPHGRQDTEVKSYTAAPALGPPHRDAILTFCPSLTLFIPLRAASAHARGFDRCSRASAHDAFMGRSGALTVSAGRRPDRIDDEKAGEQLKEVSEPARSAGAPKNHPPHRSVSERAPPRARAVTKFASQPSHGMRKLVETAAASPERSSEASSGGIWDERYLSDVVAREARWDDMAVGVGLGDLIDALEESSRASEEDIDWDSLVKLKGCVVPTVRRQAAQTLPGLWAVTEDDWGRGRALHGVKERSHSEAMQETSAGWDGEDDADDAVAERVSRALPCVVPTHAGAPARPQGGRSPEFGTNPAREASPTAERPGIRGASPTSPPGPAFLGGSLPWSRPPPLSPLSASLTPPWSLPVTFARGRSSAPVPATHPGGSRSHGAAPQGPSDMAASAGRLVGRRSDADGSPEPGRAEDAPSASAPQPRRWKSESRGLSRLHVSSRAGAEGPGSDAAATDTWIPGGRALGGAQSLRLCSPSARGSSGAMWPEVAELARTVRSDRPPSTPAKDAEPGPLRAREVSGPA